MVLLSCLLGLSLGDLDLRMVCEKRSLLFGICGGLNLGIGVQILASLGALRLGLPCREVSGLGFECFGSVVTIGLNQSVGGLLAPYYKTGTFLQAESLQHEAAAAGYLISNYKMPALFTLGLLIDGSAPKPIRISFDSHYKLGSAASRSLSTPAWG